MFVYLLADNMEAPSPPPRGQREGSRRLRRGGRRTPESRWLIEDHLVVVSMVRLRCLIPQGYVFTLILLFVAPDAFAHPSSSPLP